MDRKLINSVLCKKGFTSDTSKDHVRYIHMFNGKETGIHTKMSHGTKYKRIDDNLLSKMKGQLKLDRSEDFRNLINCSMTEDNYIEFLRNKGFSNSR